MAAERPQRRRREVLARLHGLVQPAGRMDWRRGPRRRRLPPRSLQVAVALVVLIFSPILRQMHARVGKTRLPDGGRPHPRLEPAVVEKVVVER